MHASSLARNHSLMFQRILVVLLCQDLKTQQHWVIQYSPCHSALHRWWVYCLRRIHCWVQILLAIPRSLVLMLSWYSQICDDAVFTYLIFVDSSMIISSYFDCSYYYFHRFGDNYCHIYQRCSLWVSFLVIISIVVVKSKKSQMHAEIIFLIYLLNYECYSSH